MADAITVKKDPYVVLRERLEARKYELESALPDDVKPREFIRAVMTSASINRDILACNWPSIWNACLRACRDGLLPDGVEGALVPFKSQANWIPMYQGLLRRARRSGKIKWIGANLVREGEKFERFVNETGEHLNHVPDDNFLAPVIKVYAAAITTDGGFFIAVMPIAEIEKIKKMSKASRDDAPWKLWEEEMIKKSALRRLTKQLPNSRDLMTTEDDPDDEIPSSPVIDLPLAEATTAAAAPSGSKMLLEDEAPSPVAKDTPMTGEASAQGANVTTDTAARTGVEDETRPAAEPPSDYGAGKDHGAEKHSLPHTPPQSILQAYEQGKTAKAKGLLRKTPENYRDTAHQREAIAFQSGYDGKPLPAWGL
jgi:recombination protein RecT